MNESDYSNLFNKEKPFDSNDSKAMDNNYSDKVLRGNSPETSVSKFLQGIRNEAGLETDYYKGLYRSNNVAKSRSDIYNNGDTTEQPLLNKTFRFGIKNPYGAISTAKEFIFFTKPDLNIIERDNDTGLVITDSNNIPHLSPGLRSGFWQDMFNSKKRIIELLQSSYGNHTDDPFNHLLQNMVISNLDIPSLDAPTVETSTNMYGISFSYRGSSEESDDGKEFSLEFKDDKYLNVYSYFRAYEEYETEKHHGTVQPWKPYIEYKILHDQIAVFKFIVDEDMETILYYGKYYGVFPTSLPRDAFSTDTFDNGISYTINFKSAFYEDMRPEIIDDFNSISNSLYQKCKYFVRPYNPVMGRSDCRPAKAAYIYKDTLSKTAKQHPNGYVYKLLWKGDDEA